MNITLVAVVIVILVISIYLYIYLKDIERIKDENTDNIIIKNNTIDFSTLNLRQKISQMIVIRGDNLENLYTTNFNLGGIFLDRQKSESEYSSIIDIYERNSKIKLFVTTDMEGSWNPFSKFRKFKEFSEIGDAKEAYNTGLEEGILLKKLGFNLNFAPVSEYYDKSYGGRTFNGTKKEVKDKLESYIRGLQKNIYGTCKHYPGKGMIGNLHIISDKQNITKDDLELFQTCFKNNITAVMIGHQIVEGAVDSHGKPSSISGEVIDSLGNFSGLIISDEVNMEGLSLFYKDKSEMYKDLINSGENLILDFQLNPRSFNDLIMKIEEKVKKGEINENKINISVKKILEMKGYKVK